MPGIEVLYQRDPTFFIDSTSTSSVELGTMEHPYKSMDAPLHEIYGFFSGRTDVNFTLLIREGTTAILHSPATILQAEFMTITSYSTTSAKAGKATIEFKIGAFAKHWSTRFLNMEGIEYEHLSKIA